MQIALYLLQRYQRWLSPLAAALGARCRYEQSCSAFAVQAFRTGPWPRALWLTAHRLASCHPWHALSKGEGRAGETEGAPGANRCPNR